MAYVSINLDQEFLDDSLSNSDELARRPILPKNLNLKHEMTKYKMKLKEKKKLHKQIKLREKLGNEVSKDVNSPFKWRSDTENTEENFVFSNDRILNQGNYVINIQNIKLPGESQTKNFNSTYIYNNSLAYNENIIQKTSSIKGNLFRNISKSIKFKQSDPFLNFDKKIFKVKSIDKKGYTHDNFYPNSNFINSNKDRESSLKTNDNEEENAIIKAKNTHNNVVSYNENQENSQINNHKEYESNIYTNKNNLQNSSNANYRQNVMLNRENVISAKNYNPKSLVELTYHHRAKTPSTIYNVLNKRKKEFFENIKFQNKKNSTLEPTKDLLSQKKSFLKTNNITSLLEQKRKDFIPYVFPVAWIHQLSYSNISEKNRYEKITDLFLKLRVYFNENQENELILAKEFLIKHGIYDKEYFTIDKLSNFIYFIKSEDCLRINPSFALKDITIHACRFNNNYENEDQINSEKNNFYNNVNNEVVEFENNNYNNNNNYYKNAINNSDCSNKKHHENKINSNSKSPQHNNINNINNYNHHISNNVNFLNSNSNELIKSANNFFVQGVANQIKNSSESVNVLAMSQNNFHSVFNPKPKPTITQSHKVPIHNLIQYKAAAPHIKIEERTNASMHPILNEKIYKIEYSNIKAVIENLEPEIAKIKGLSINKSYKKLIEKSYERAINNMKKSKRKLNEEIRNTVGQLPLKDIEQIKKKNKLLEYIILQRSKNRLKLENDKRVFELEYNGSTVNTNDVNCNNVISVKIKDGKSFKVKDALNTKQSSKAVEKLKLSIDRSDTKNSFFPNVVNFKNSVK